MAFFCIAFFIYFIDWTFTFSEFQINSRSISKAGNNPNNSIWSVWNTCPRNSEMKSTIERNELVASDYSAYFIYHPISGTFRETNANEQNKLSYCIKLTFGSDVETTTHCSISICIERKLQHDKRRKTHSHSCTAQLFPWKQLHRSNYLFSLRLIIHNSKNISQTNIARYIHFKWSFRFFSSQLLLSVITQ